MHSHHYRSTTAAASRASGGRAGHGQLGHGHRGRGLAGRRATSSWPRGAGPGSCPSTSSAARSTSSSTAPRVPLRVRQRCMHDAASSARSATWSATGCPSPTTAWSRRTRRSRTDPRAPHPRRRSRPSRTSRRSTATTRASSPTARRGGRRRRRLLHRLQGQLPVLRRGPRLRARQRPAAVPARVPPRSRRLYFLALLQPLGATMPLAEAQSEWIARSPAGRVPPAGAGARCAPTSTRERARDAQALRGLQAPHDAGRLRRLPVRAAARAAARRRPGAPGRVRAAGAGAGGRVGGRGRG